MSKQPPFTLCLRHYVEYPPEDGCAACRDGRPPHPDGIRRAPTEPTPEVRTWPAGTVRPDNHKGTHMSVCSAHFEPVPGCVACATVLPTPFPEQSAEKAVVEAAEAWAEWWSQHVNGLIETTYERDLFKAVLALRATRQPQPVRPEEVEPGTRFRFADGAFGEWRKVKGPHGTWYALREGDWILLTLKDEDRIIPLPDQP